MSRFERALSPSRRLFRQRGPRALVTAGRSIGTLVCVALGGLAGGMLELPSIRRAGAGGRGSRGRSGVVARALVSGQAGSESGHATAVTGCFGGF